MASSVDLFGRVTGMEEQMCFFKSLSKTFMTVDVRATGR